MNNVAIRNVYVSGERTVSIFIAEKSRNKKYVSDNLTPDFFSGVFLYPEDGDDVFSETFVFQDPKRPKCQKRQSSVTY
jgi:hypothetical protein